MVWLCLGFNGGSGFLNSGSWVLGYGVHSPVLWLLCRVLADKRRLLIGLGDTFRKLCTISAFSHFQGGGRTFTTYKLSLFFL